MMRNVACMCRNSGCIFERQQGIRIWKWENSSLISDKTKGNMKMWGCKKNQLIFFLLPAFWDLCEAHLSLPCSGDGGKAESIHSYRSSSGRGYGSAKCTCAYCPVWEYQFLMIVVPQSGLKRQHVPKEAEWANPSHAMEALWCPEFSLTVLISAVPE